MASHAVARPHPPSLQDARILVVDDNEDSRTILDIMFTHLGALVVTAASGADALHVFEASRPHVIVSDLSMPGMDGLEFMRRVRARPGEAQHPTPAIALSGFTQTQDRERARRAGYQIFVAKPVDPIALAQEVARLAPPLAEQRGPSRAPTSGADQPPAGRQRAAS